MIGRLLLLLSAYSPLPLLIGLRIHNLGQMWVLFGVAAAAAAALPVWCGVRRRASQRQVARVLGVSAVADELAGYLLSFVLPFVTLSAPTTRDLVAFGVFGVLLVLAYLQSGRLALNPWLFVFGYRVLALDIGGQQGLLISRRLVSVGDEVSLVRLTRGLWLGRSI